MSFRRSACVTQVPIECPPPRLIPLIALLAFLLPIGCSPQFKRKEIYAITSHNEKNVLSERVGMEEAAAEANVGLYWNGPSNWDVQRQIDLMESAVRAHSYGIAVNPASLFAINTSIRDALAAHIPVVIMLDRAHIAPAAHLYYVLEDTKATATLVTQRLSRLARGPGEVAVFGVDPLFPGSMDRYQDLEEALGRDCPNLQPEGRSLGVTGYDASEIGAERILSDHPSLRAIITLDMQSALAAVAAIRNQHRQKKVYVIAYDQSNELFVLLRRGDIDSLVIQDMRGIGKRAVNDIMADRLGQHPPALLFLKPILVTSSNIDDEAVQQFILMNWSHR